MAELSQKADGVITIKTPSWVSQTKGLNGYEKEGPSACNGSHRAVESLSEKAYPIRENTLVPPYFPMLNKHSPSMPI